MTRPAMAATLDVEPLLLADSIDRGLLAHRLTDAATGAPSHVAAVLTALAASARAEGQPLTFDATGLDATGRAEVGQALADAFEQARASGDPARAILVHVWVAWQQWERRAARPAGS